MADAALAEDDAKLLDELGDLLFQTFFLSLLLEERGARSRAGRPDHPREACPPPPARFGGELDSAGAVKRQWEAIKTEEEAGGHLPSRSETPRALLLAQKVQRRAAAIGFEYPDRKGALSDLEAEGRASRRAKDELGDVLFAAVNVARHLGVDPELELRRASARFVGRVERAAELASAEGLDFDQLELDEQDRWYDLAKEGEQSD